jgi:hypothetical protein
MKKYHVTMIHVVHYMVDEEVEANSEEEAIELAKDYKMKNTRYIDQEFEIIEVKEMKE